MPKGADTLRTRHILKRDGFLREYFGLPESARHIMNMVYRLPSVTKACSKIYCGMKMVDRLSQSKTSRHSPLGRATAATDRPRMRTPTVRLAIH